MYKRQSENISYIKSLFGSCNIKGTIVKIDATDDGENDYDKVTGVKIMNEDTLIVGDSKNNILVVFEDDKTCVHKSITKDIHIKNLVIYDADCVIHKKQKPTKVPNHISLHITYVQNNFYKLQKTSANTTNSKNFRQNIAGNNNEEENLHNFMNKNYICGGFISIKEVTAHAEWKTTFRKYISVKRIHTCKSCGVMSAKGCCSLYSSHNRVKVTMIIGWSHANSDPNNDP